MARLKDKVAIVVGGGQTPGDTVGNGKATAHCRRHAGKHLRQDIAEYPRTLAAAKDKYFEALAVRSHRRALRKSSKST